MRVHASGRNAKLVARETEKRLSVEGTWPCVPLGLFSRGAGGGARGWRVSVAAGSHNPPAHPYVCSRPGGGGERRGGYRRAQAVPVCGLGSD